MKNKERLAELEATFDLAWRADQRAIKRWHAAHPSNELVWPDRADMVVWLMDRIEAVKAALSDIESLAQMVHPVPEHPAIGVRMVPWAAVRTRVHAALDGAMPEGLVICPLCGDPERAEDILGGVCLTCADAITFAQHNRRASIVVEVEHD